MPLDLKQVQILECTLRDGSYLIDFQFTADDTTRLTRALDKLGMRLIEVGHGVGIAASPSKGRAAATDVEYVRAARAGSKNALIGMFCIPGIATLDDLKACVDAGLQFVRIGANVDAVAQTEEFIGEARKMGLLVFCNFMKSYAMKPEAFASVARISADFGAQCLYVVDSAGGMMPDEVKHYTQAILDVVDMPVGFHSHNNLGLAVANSMAAIDAGATIVDTTLLGMGRSSGNAPTETMVSLLQRRYGACKDMDPTLYVELAERAVAPLMRNRWDDSMKTALGMAQVHSMYAPKIERAAEEAGLNLYSLIAEVGRRDMLNLSDVVLEKASKAAASEQKVSELLGDVSLVEAPVDASDLAGAVLLARKLNLPVHAVLVSADKFASVEVTRAAVEIATTEAKLADLHEQAKFQGVDVQSPPDRNIRFSA
ncbi:4-hydroxy-2-oxovalerate aldolase [Alphaproteobacteria bacterium HT1-32]|nr:4-hydroxy-2-oxovalerate aldolase [Alphaproteobacteria bacterium HT1-32]|tara:strand:+ start:8594 stop:9874 length:1281 start_codon:yes stop_codon:yes gene_type:complete